MRRPADRKPLFRLLLQSNLALVVLVLAMALLVAAGSYRTYSIDQAREDLEARGRIVAYTVSRICPDLDPKHIANLCRDLGTYQATRITVIDPSGAVLGDSDKDPGMMENHADRPEVRDALRGLVGSSRRYSETLQRELAYVAVPLVQDDSVIGVVRTALPLRHLRDTWRARQRDLLLPGLSIAAAATLLGAWVSLRIARPAERLREGAERFARGELDYRLELPNQRELADLADDMNRMAADLQERIDRLLHQGQT